MRTRTEEAETGDGLPLNVGIGQQVVGGTGGEMMLQICGSEAMKAFQDHNQIFELNLDTNWLLMQLL